MKSASKTNSKSSLSPVGKKLIQARLPFKTVTAPSTPPQPSSSSSLSSSTAAATTPAAAGSALRQQPQRQATVVLDSSDDTSLPATTNSSTTDGLARKRKLSATSPSKTGGRQAKVNRVESKENVAASPSPAESTVVLSSDEDDADTVAAPKTPKTTGKANGTTTSGGGRRKATPKGSSSAKKKTPQSQRKTPKRNNTPKGKKRKASPPDDDDAVVVVMDDTMTTASDSEAVHSFAIKLPMPKKRTLAARTSVNKTPDSDGTPAKTPAKSPAKVAMVSLRMLTAEETAAETRVKTPEKEIPAETARISPVKTPAKTPVKETIVSTPGKETPAKTPLKKTPAKAITAKTPLKEMLAKQMAKESPVKDISANTPIKETLSKNTPAKVTTAKSPAKGKPSEASSSVKETASQAPRRSRRSLPDAASDNDADDASDAEVLNDADDKDSVLSDDESTNASAKSSASLTRSRLSRGSAIVAAKESPAETPLKKTPVKSTPIKQTPTKALEKKTPAKETPLKEMLVKQLAKEALAKTTPSKDVSAEKPLEEKPSKQPAKETPSKTTITPAKVQPVKTPLRKPTSKKPPAQETPSKSPNGASKNGDGAEVLNCDEDDSVLSDDESTNTSAKSSATLKRNRLSQGSVVAPKVAAIASPTVSVTATGGGSLTPKQLLRKQESDARQREKQRQKEERERKLLEEKEQRQRERDEKERQRKKERDDKEEQRRREREEKEEQKLDERKRKEEQKEEERKRKEDQREEERKRKEELKEEERKRKEDEKLAKEEAEKKKKEKSSAAFTKFFTARRSTVTGALNANGEASNDAEPRQNFMPFRIKEDMKMAPLVRRAFSDRHRDAFDERVLRADEPVDRSDLYLAQLRAAAVPRGRDGKTWTQVESEVQIVEDELEGAADVIEEPVAKQTFRAKFFKFTENRRPPYYGTWRRRSATITARKPFASDTTHLDYECDSDDEWEEEEPGESLHGSDDDKDDKESDDEYDIDNQFFVPHGHLSDEEGAGGDDLDDDDDECGGGDNAIGDADDDNSPAAQKAKLKIIQLQFANDMKKKTEKIKPRLVGCVWQRPDGGQPEACPTIIWEMLRARSMVFAGASVRLVKPAADSTEATDADAAEPSQQDGRRRLPYQFNDDDTVDLIRLLHGNKTKKAFMCKEFLAHFTRKHAGNEAAVPPSHVAVSAKVQELARYQSCPDEGTWQGKFCWYVSAEMRQRYGVAELGMPNEWQYTLKRPARLESDAEATAGAEGGGGEKTSTATPKEKAAKPNAADKTTTTTTPNTTSSTSKTSKFNIAQFTKVLSNEEKRAQFELNATPENATKKANGTAAKTTPAASRKRVTLTKVKTASPQATTTAAAAAATPTTAAAGPKKRVSLLASVPLNQEIPAATKNALISKFLGKPQAPKAAAAVAATEVAGEKKRATEQAVETIVLDD